MTWLTAVTGESLNVEHVAMVQLQYTWQPGDLALWAAYAVLPGVGRFQITETYPTRDEASAARDAILLGKLAPTP